MTRNILPWLIAAAGLLYIFVIPDDPQPVKMLFKLIPMWLIIAYAFVIMPKARRLHHWLLAAGLIFCMFGDYLLQWFVVGLASFLVGHLFYTAGFLARWRYSTVRALVALPLAAFGIWAGTRIVGAIRADGDTSLVIPVIAYIVVILLMTWSAFMSGSAWAMVGSVLFTASDTILAFNRFVESIPNAGVWIMLTYYTAQFCIARSAAGDDREGGFHLPRHSSVTRG